MTGENVSILDVLDQPEVVDILLTNHAQPAIERSFTKAMT